jgi:hypothetical protein
MQDAPPVSRAAHPLYLTWIWRTRAFYDIERS